MFDRIKDYINQSQTRKNIFALCIFAVLTIINLLIGLIPAVRTASTTGSIIPTGLQVASYIVLALHIAICIFCRIKYCSNILRGIFFYQLPPILLFIIELGMRIGGSQSANGFVIKMFDLLTVYSRPFAYLITPFIGMSEIYTKLISHIVFILITYFAYSGIKKSIAFQEKLREKRELEKH